jgi:hypothetical protein
MKRRPWPIVILALLHLLEPIPKVALYAHLYDHSILNFLSLVFQNGSGLEIFQFFCLFPMAGLAIYSMKKWSYPVFLAVEGWTFYANYNIWMSSPDVLTFPMLVSFFILNTVVVGYFLIPEVRAPYFNRNLRWWESKPRYRIDLRTSLEYQTLEKVSQPEGMIDNISEGGVFIKSAYPFQINDAVKVNFEYGNKEYTFNGRVVHCGAPGSNGYGIKFERLNQNQKKGIKALVKELDRKGLPKTLEKKASLASFKEWAARLFETGEGLIPDLPKSYTNSRSQVATSTAGRGGDESNEDEDRAA